MLFVILILESNGDRMKREIEKEWEGKNNRFFISLIRADAVCHNRCYFFDAALMMRKSNRSIERRRRRRRRRQHSTRKLNNSYWNVNFRQEILCDWLAAVCESELWFQHTHKHTNTSTDENISFAQSGCINWRYLLVIVSLCVFVHSQKRHHHDGTQRERHTFVYSRICADRLNTRYGVYVFFFSLFRKANGDWSEIAVNMILLYDERKLDNCANSFSMLHFNVFIYYLWSFKWEYLLVMDKYLSALLLSVNIYFGTVDADDIVDVVAKARKMLICWVSIWSLSPPLFGQSRSDSLLFAVYVRLCVCVPLVVVAVVVYCHCHCRPCIANVHFALVGNV